MPVVPASFLGVVVLPQPPHEKNERDTTRKPAKKRERCKRALAVAMVIYSRIWRKEAAACSDARESMVARLRQQEIS